MTLSKSKKNLQRINIINFEFTNYNINCINELYDFLDLHSALNISFINKRVYLRTKTIREIAKIYKEIKTIEQTNSTGNIRYANYITDHPFCIVTMFINNINYTNKYDKVIIQRAIGRYLNERLENARNTDNQKFIHFNRIDTIPEYIELCNLMPIENRIVYIDQDLLLRLKLETIESISKSFYQVRFININEKMNDSLSVFSNNNIKIHVDMLESEQYLNNKIIRTLIANDKLTVTRLRLNNIKEYNEKEIKQMNTKYLSAHLEEGNLELLAKADIIEIFYKIKDKNLNSYIESVHKTAKELASKTNKIKAFAINYLSADDLFKDFVIKIIEVLKKTTTEELYILDSIGVESNNYISSNQFILPLLKILYKKLKTFIIVNKEKSEKQSATFKGLGYFNFDNKIILDIPTLALLEESFPMLVTIINNNNLSEKIDFISTDFSKESFINYLFKNNLNIYERIVSVNRAKYEIELKFKKSKDDKSKCCLTFKQGVNQYCKHRSTDQIKVFVDKYTTDKPEYDLNKEILEKLIYSEKLVYVLIETDKLDIMQKFFSRKFIGTNLAIIVIYVTDKKLIDEQAKLFKKNDKVLVIYKDENSFYNNRSICNAAFELYSYFDNKYYL